jgi:hypothetical protein
MLMDETKPAVEQTGRKMALVERRVWQRFWVSHELSVLQCLNQSEGSTPTSISDEVTEEHGSTQHKTECHANLWELRLAFLWLDCIWTDNLKYL